MITKTTERLFGSTPEASASNRSPDARESYDQRLNHLLGIATQIIAQVGYDKASKVAKKAAAERRSVRDVVLEMKLMPESELNDILDVRDMTNPGIPGDG